MKTLSITAIDALNYNPTINALYRTIDVITNLKYGHDFVLESIKWFSDIDFPDDGTYGEGLCDWTKINRFKKYTEDYNYVCLHLMPHVVTADFNLIIHPDGFAVNSEAWTNEFFDYDYIGAQWKDGYVGNGGFSLRSRKLYDALLDIKPPVRAKDYPKPILQDSHNFVIDNTGEYVIPEDNIICKIYKDLLETKYGIKFAPAALADRFSIEHNMGSSWVGKSFGFHGKHGIAEKYGVIL